MENQIYLYYIHFPDVNLFKIGISACPEYRAKITARDLKSSYKILFTEGFDLESEAREAELIVKRVYKSKRFKFYTEIFTEDILNRCQSENS